MKVARTSRNAGRKFWGCRHYKMSVGGQRKRCSICRELGHNKKMCPLNPAIIQPTQSTQAQSSQPIAPSQPSSPQSPQPPQPSQDSIRDLSEPIQRQKLNIRRKDP
ncbi:hypothetical protein LR48_Vigan1871s000100 [Vigna angularis]|nr:hypothetical protein LR48_Vigan1871s000100 [Vigna angularis]